MDISTFNPLESLKLKYFRFLNLAIYIGFPCLPLRITRKLPIIIAKKSNWTRRNKETERELHTSFGLLLTTVFPWTRAQALI